MLRGIELLRNGIVIMNTTQVKCFISLGQTHNYTQTAKELYLAQPTVSKNLHNLEAEIGVKLIKNEHRQISLTEEGEYFYKRLINIDAEMEQALSHIKKEKTDANHTIRIGYTGLPFEKQFLPAFIQMMHRKGNWNIELKPISLSKPHLYEKLENKEVDFLLYQSDFFSDEQFAFSPMMQAGFSVIIRRDNPLRKYKVIPLSELHRNKVYLWDGKTPLPSVANLKAALSATYKPGDTPLQMINKVSLASIMVQANDGIAVVPSFVYDQTNHEIYYRFLDWDRSIKYGLGYLNEKKNDPCFKLVINNMQKAIAIAKNKWIN